MTGEEKNDDATNAVDDSSSGRPTAETANSNSSRNNMSSNSSHSLPNTTNTGIGQSNNPLVQSINQILDPILSGFAGNISYSYD